MVLLRVVALPDRVPVGLRVTDGRVGWEELPQGSEAVDGYLLPGLVDCHTHPGAATIGAPLDEQELRTDLVAHRDAGVTTVRVAGAPERLPAWVSAATDLPRVLSAGPWLSTPGLFFPGWGRCVGEDELPDAAAEEAVASSGWVKLRGDWVVDEETVAEPGLLPADVLAETVRRVHDVGGRVLIHATHEQTCAAAVAAGVDSLEHGMWLDHELLPEMARRGIALCPTFTVWANQRDAMEELESPAREWFEDGLDRLGPLSTAAARAGVRVIAGTDSRPHGNIATEVRHLAAGGLSLEVAVGAASWVARDVLDLPRYDETSLDAAVYERDPLTDLGVLDDPAHVVVGGRLVR